MQQLHQNASVISNHPSAVAPEARAVTFPSLFCLKLKKDKLFIQLRLSFEHIIILRMTSQPPLPEKITQLQCHQCNVGLQSQFLNWLNQSFKYQPNILSGMHQEIEALLGVAEFAYTVGRDRPQAGDFLQNIQFKPLTKTQKLLWLLLSVILPYITRRLYSYAATKESPFWKSIQSALGKLQKIITVGEFINYAIFILKGQFRTITQRILGMPMKFIDPENKRILNFALMNRMLVWQVYEHFLKNVLPSVFSFCSGPLKNLFYLSSFLRPEADLDKKGCVYCASQEPVMPHQAMPCQHTACYYCCKSTKSEKCPLCSKPIDRWAPLLH